MKSTVQDPSVRHRFSAAASSYDRHADAQRLAADHLLTHLPAPDAITTILEAGCGTGYLTRALAARFPTATIDALDLAPAMIEAARAAGPPPHRIRWHVSDLAHYPSQSPCDLLASNAALHWIEPRHAAFAAAHSLLRPGGTLVCSLMVHGTLRELHEARLHCAPHKPPRRSLPRPEELRTAIQDSRFHLQHFETRQFRTRHPSARALLAALHDMGLTGGPFSRATTPLHRGELLRLIDTYQARYGTHGGDVFATYEVTFIRAVREP